VLDVTLHGLIEKDLVKTAQKFVQYNLPAIIKKSANWSNRPRTRDLRFPDADESLSVLWNSTCNLGERHRRNQPEDYPKTHHSTARAENLGGRG